MATLTVSTSAQLEIIFKLIAEESVNGGAVSLLYDKEVKMLKRNNPIKDAKVYQRIKYNALYIGCSYEKCMNTAAKRSDSDENFDAGSPSGTQPVKGYEKYLFEKITDPTVKYLRLYYDPRIDQSLVTETIGYYINDKLADASEVELIKQFTSKSSKPSYTKQINAGINPELITRMPKIFKLEHIVNIKHNKMEYGKR
ncbi:MAG: hypothetical protein ACRDD8_16590 [Bacteroidales bacterium]